MRKAVEKDGGDAHPTVWMYLMELNYTLTTVKIGFIIFLFYNTLEAVLSSLFKCWLVTLVNNKYIYSWNNPRKYTTLYSNKVKFQVP